MWSRKRVKKRVRRTKKLLTKWQKQARKKMRKFSQKISKKYKNRLVSACNKCKDENLAQITCHKRLPKFFRNRTQTKRKNCFELWRVYHNCMRKNGMRQGNSFTCKLINK